MRALLVAATCLRDPAAHGCPSLPPSPAELDTAAQCVAVAALVERERLAPGLLLSAVCAGAPVGTNPGVADRRRLRVEALRKRLALWPGDTLSSHPPPAEFALRTGPVALRCAQALLACDELSLALDPSARGSRSGGSHVPAPGAALPGSPQSGTLTADDAAIVRRVRASALEALQLAAELCALHCHGPGARAKVGSGSGGWGFAAAPGACSSDPALVADALQVASSSSSSSSSQHHPYLILQELAQVSLLWPGPALPAMAVRKALPRAGTLPVYARAALAQAADALTAHVRDFDARLAHLSIGSSPAAAWAASLLCPLVGSRETESSGRTDPLLCSHAALKEDSSLEMVRVATAVLLQARCGRVDA